MELPGEQSGYLGTFDPSRVEQLDRASAAERTGAVAELIRKTSATAAVAAMQPFPLVDAAILTPLQHRLVRSIARIRRCRLDDDDIKGMFRAVRGPIVASQATIAGAKVFLLVPFFPAAVGVSLAYALTHAIGEVTDEYLSQPGMEVEDMKPRLAVVSKRRFRQVLHVKRAQVRAMFSEPQTRRKIRELGKAARAGQIGPAEEVRQMDALLAASS
jgi:uncharacterized protein (DUF697 family)